MIRWCSYCYTYLGQVEPIDDLSVTHGICDGCLATMHEAPPDQEGFFEGLRQLSDDLAGFAKVPGGSDAQVEAYCVKALALGLKPPEILLSLMQPALYNAGAAYSRGEMSVAQEHALTGFVERAVAYLRLHAALIPPPLQGPVDVMLVPVDGNTHTLGLRIVEFLLASEGYRCLMITPGLPALEIEALATAWSPRVLGISLALPQQVPTLQVLADWSMKQAPPAHLVAGGFAFLDEQLKAPEGVTVVSPLLGTQQLLKALHEAGLPPKA